MYRITRMNNGMTVATAEMPHMASVSVGLWVGTGGRHEPDHLNGISHFIEHMLFKGTRRRTARQITAAIEGVGGHLNAYTSEEATCYYCKAHADHFPTLLDVLMDMFVGATFASGEIRKERAVIKEEIASYIDQPSQHVFDLLNEAIWPEHPMGRCLTGTIKSVDGINRSRMISFHRQHYVGANTLLTVAGQVTHAQVLRLARRYARAIPAGEKPRYRPAMARNIGPGWRCQVRTTAQTQFAVGFRACSRYDDFRYPLRLLNTILGENMSSRLFQVLREDHGLAYAVQSSVSLHADTGALIISAGVEPEQLGRTLKYLARELKRVSEKPPSARELRQAYDYLVGQLELSLEATGSQCNWMGENLLAYDRIVPVEEIKKRLRTVTPSEVRRAAREFFRYDQTCLALVSPDPYDAKLLRSLRL